MFLPLAPNSVMGGFLAHIPEERILDVDMTVEEGIQSSVRAVSPSTRRPTCRPRRCATSASTTPRASPTTSPGRTESRPELFPRRARTVH
jgi:uncharacterized membrane protein